MKAAIRLVVDDPFPHLANMSHSGDCMFWEFPAGGLTGQHHNICAIQNRIQHLGGKIQACLMMSHFLRRPSLLEVGGHRLNAAKKHQLLQRVWAAEHAPSNPTSGSR